MPCGWGIGDYTATIRQSKSHVQARSDAQPVPPNPAHSTGGLVADSLTRMVLNVPSYIWALFPLKKIWALSIISQFLKEKCWAGVLDAAIRCLHGAHRRRCTATPLSLPKPAPLASRARRRRPLRSLRLVAQLQTDDAGRAILQCARRFGTVKCKLMTF
jgi:hypothetical protein